MVNGRRRLTRFDLLGSLTLLTLPWALIEINRSWILTSSGTSDGWAYGYFTNVSQFLRAFPGIYNGTRLAWILPGALAHQAPRPMNWDAAGTIPTSGWRGRSSHLTSRLAIRPNLRALCAKLSE